MHDVEFGGTGPRGHGSPGSGHQNEKCENANPKPHPEYAPGPAEFTLLNVMHLIHPIMAHLDLKQIQASPGPAIPRVFNPTIQLTLLFRFQPIGNAQFMPSFVCLS